MNQGDHDLELAQTLFWAHLNDKTGGIVILTWYISLKAHPFYFSVSILERLDYKLEEQFLVKYCSRTTISFNSHNAWACNLYCIVFILQVGIQRNINIKYIVLHS